MTDQRDLKRRVRERMDKTGESYTAARKHVLAQREEPAARATPEPERPRPFDVIDPIDLTEPARAVGFACRVLMFPSLAARVDTARMLVQIRDALLATEADPWTRQLRATALRGEVWPRPRYSRGEASEELMAFVRRAQAGIGGVSPGGTMLAMHAGGEMTIIAVSAQRSPAGGDAQPLLWIHAVTESFGTIRITGLLR